MYDDSCQNTHFFSIDLRTMHSRFEGYVIFFVTIYPFIRLSAVLAAMLRLCFTLRGYLRKSSRFQIDVHIPTMLNGTWSKLPDHLGTRWAPSSYKWSYNPYKWPYKWLAVLITIVII